MKIKKVRGPRWEVLDDCGLFIASFSTEEKAIDYANEHDPHAHHCKDIVPGEEDWDVGELGRSQKWNG